jgi:PPIC-type PPIASE domain
MYIDAFFWVWIASTDEPMFEKCLSRSDALRIVQTLREDKSRFSSLAIEYSKDNGGFVGIRFLGELMPELSEAISNGQEGEVIGPIQTNLGYLISCTLSINKVFIYLKVIKSTI